MTLYRVPILDDFSLGRRGGEGRRVLQVGDRIRGGRGRGIAATDGPDGAQAGARIVPEGAAQAYAELAEGHDGGDAGVTSSDVDGGHADPKSRQPRTDKVP